MFHRLIISNFTSKVKIMYKLGDYSAHDLRFENETMIIIVNTLIGWKFYLYFITRKWRVLTMFVWCSTEHSNPNVIFLFQVYNSHLATFYLRYTIIAIIPRLYFTINDEWGESIFSFFGQNGQVKNVDSSSRCC